MNFNTSALHTLRCRCFCSYSVHESHLRGPENAPAAVIHVEGAGPEPEAAVAAALSTYVILLPTPAENPIRDRFVAAA